MTRKGALDREERDIDQAARPTESQGAAAGQESHVNGSQTLDRGLRILRELVDGPLPVPELAKRLGVHRTIVYRLLRTLTSHQLVVNVVGGYRLDVGVLALARGVHTNLQQVAPVHLSRLAETLGATAVLTVPDGEYAVCVLAIEPQRTSMHIAYRPGVRHRLDHGASGLAILAGRPPAHDERPEVTAARRDGYATSVNELQAGAAGVAAPVVCSGVTQEASVAVVGLIDQLDIDSAAAAVRETAAAVAAAMGG